MLKVYTRHERYFLSMGLSHIYWAWDYLVFPDHGTISYFLIIGLSRIYWAWDYLVFTEHWTISYLLSMGLSRFLMSMGLSRVYWAWDYLVITEHGTISYFLMSMRLSRVYWSLDYLVFTEHGTISYLLSIGFSRILLFLLASYSCLFKTNCAFIWLAVSNIYIYIYTLRCFHIRSFTYMHYCNN